MKGNCNTPAVTHHPQSEAQIVTPCSALGKESEPLAVGHYSLGKGSRPHRPRALGDKIIELEQVIARFRREYDLTSHA